jgi:hypothetical protein
VKYVTKTGSVVLLNKKIHILLSEVYCVWQIFKTPTNISNNPVSPKIQNWQSLHHWSTKANRLTNLEPNIDIGKDFIISVLKLHCGEREKESDIERSVLLNTASSDSVI